MSVQVVNFATRMPSVPDADVDVLIVGGGFCGAMLAVHLLRSTSLSLAVVDRSGWPGRGLAYSTPHKFHLLNVPAGQMSAFPDEPDHFLRWAQSNYNAAVQPRSFVARSVYGEYIGSLLEKAAAESGWSRFHWIQDEALSLRDRDGVLTVQRKYGAELMARAVALATGNFPPADPKIPGLKQGARHYVPFAWSSTALEAIPPAGSVLLIGSGLTAVDMIMALKSKAFKGHIHVISRRGLLPHRHKQCQEWPLFWNEKSPRTVPELLRLIRQQIAFACARDIDWRSVFDSLRPVTQQIWQSLSTNEQRRFLRHCRAYWDVHRHRVAPEIADLLADMRSEGQVLVRRGRITRYEEERGKVMVTYRESGEEERVLQVDRVINCTGSETDCRRIDDSLMTSLIVQGYARPDPLFLGLDVDEHGALLDYGGFPSRALFAIGPTRKGHLWETTAVPEIRVQAAALARHLSHMGDSRAKLSSRFDAAV